MHRYPELTYRILAHASPYITFDFNNAVDWACEMLHLGFETPHLLMLAAIIKPTDRCECLYYLETALKELNLEKIEDEDSLIAASWMGITRIAGGENVRQNLTKVYSFYSIAQPDDCLFDFALLYWAWEELDEMGCQFYWADDDLHKNNIEQVVTNCARQWVEKYRSKVKKWL